VSDDETLAWLALALCTDGRPDQWLALARACGGATATVAATDAELAEAGAATDAVAKLRAAWPEGASRVREDCRRLGIRVAALPSPDYPPALRAIADPPLTLFWRGAPPSACLPAVALVGARRSTGDGERVARQVAREAAAAGVVVVSGLARGIDGAAHRGALETGRTFAVLAGGLDHIYPGEHRSLAERLVEAGGTLLSEQPPGRRPVAWLFPFRNRVITGLAAATVVVEARLRSGSLASARHALEQGRDVFAVPGPIDSPLSEGTNRLLGQGAAPLCSTSDLGVVAGLQACVQKKYGKGFKKKYIHDINLSPDEALLLKRLVAGAATADELADASGFDGTRVLTLLTALELDGRIRREDHGRFRACSPSPSGPTLPFMLPQ
jgi:DNA processing protein